MSMTRLGALGAASAALLLLDAVRHDGIEYRAGDTIRVPDVMSWEQAEELVLARVARPAPVAETRTLGGAASDHEVADLRAEVARLTAQLAAPATVPVPDVVRPAVVPEADVARDNALIADAATEPARTPALDPAPGMTVVVATRGAAEAVEAAAAIAETGADGASRGRGRNAGRSQG